MAVSNHTQAWKFVFECLGLEYNNLDSIDYRDYSNHESVLTRSILYMHAMETFLPYTLNLAERNRDTSKIVSLGPFAETLRFISLLAQANRNLIRDPSSFLYRASHIPLKIFQDYRNKLNRKEKLVLDGYTSSSESLETALKYISKEVNKDDAAVVYQMVGFS